MPARGQELTDSAVRAAYPSVANREALTQTVSNWDSEMRVAIDISTDEIAAFCQRHAIRTLSLFGSVIRDAFTPDIVAASAEAFTHDAV